ncbi:ATP-binding protein [Reyranella sp.]|uniref:ATP-binding protein n=1 Tax=Reyranella sp. TaxID=1929291 RepID=UPI00272FB031|nr:ATP-binding protein [Reyranella sp.]MDP2378617.1 ATP-binding protein [Reyranella sp.]
MSLNQTFVAALPRVGSQALRLAGRTVSFVATLMRWLVTMVLPAARREGRVIGIVSVAIVLFIAGFTSLVLREIDDSSRASGQAHVEQLGNAVTRQMGTMLFMVENALSRAGKEIRVRDDAHRIIKLDAQHQVAANLLADFFFVDPEGQVVSAMTHGEALAHRDLSDRAYFRIHLNSLGLASLLSRPVHGRLTGAELLPVSRPVRRPHGELIGVLVAMIDVKALDRIWQDIGLRPDDTLDLIGEDGAVWMSWPHRPISENAGDTLAFSRHIAGWPMQVVAKVDQASVDRQNFAAKRAIVGSAAVGSVMVGLFGFLLANRAREVARERDAADAVRARLTAALNAVPVEFVEYDRDRRLIMANQAARDASPWRTPGAARGKTVDEVMAIYAEHFQAEDTAAAWQAWVAQTIIDFDRGGVADSRRPDGQWRRSYVSDMPGGGRVVVRVDITEAKRHEAQLAGEMERLNSVFQSTGAGIVMLDRDGRIVLVNRQVLETFGKTAAEVIGQTHSELGLKGIDTVLGTWQRASGPQRLKAHEYERHLVHADDGTKRIVKVTADPIQDETGRLRFIVMIAVDDTERRQAEIRLFDSSRLANLGEMATGMAHALNQPLAVIGMATESLIEELEAPEAAAIPAELSELIRNKLDRVIKQVDRASGLVRSLRAVAHKPTNDPVPFDIVEAARTSGDLLREQLRAARIDFQLDLPPSGSMVRGEANQLQQVLISLVLNARDALLDDTGRPPTGTLGRIALRLAATPANGGLELTVEDDGPGIPEAVLPRLFEPFFTTKPTGKGAGLSLSISHGIVKRMGGTISAENRSEGGACFRISFPPS